MKYSFGSDESVIKDMEVIKLSKEPRGIIHTPEHMTPEQAAEIKENMVQSGYKVLAGEHEGKPVLKIDGFGSANNLLASVADDGSVKGDFTAEKTTSDEPKKDKNDQSKLILFGAGTCFAVASSAILAAGSIRQSAGETFQGFAGIVPAIGLMWSSQQTAESQMSYLYRDLKEFAENNNLRMGNDVRAIINEREAPDDLFHNLQRGVFENGPSANNLIKAIAVSAGTQGAFKQGNMWKTAGNAIMVTGMLTANALPEQHAEHQTSVHLGNEVGKKAGELSEPPEQEKGFVGHIVEKIQARPQILAGSFALVQQALKAVGNERHDKVEKQKFDDEYNKKKPIYEQGIVAATDAKNAENVIKFGMELDELEKHKAKNARYADAVIYDRISMAAYTLGYGLYTMTKKHNGAKLELDPVVEICANMVSDYPLEQQKAVTQRLATFLGNHNYVNENVDDLVSKINHKMAVLAESPWISLDKPLQAANQIVPFNNFATRLDGAKQQQVEEAWHKGEPSSSLIEAKRQSLEKLVPSKIQPAIHV